jgi:hypothetical protein
MWRISMRKVEGNPGLLLTSLAGLFGLAGLTKRKEERN